MNKQINNTTVMKIKTKITKMSITIIVNSKGGHEKK